MDSWSMMKQGEHDDHLTGGQGVAGSNPVIPTIFHRVTWQVPPPEEPVFVYGLTQG